MSGSPNPAEAAALPILCVGAAHWDVIGRTLRPLPAGADVPGRVTRAPGGVARNVAAALARLGHSVALIAAAGRDAAGDALLADLESRGVDVRGAHRDAGPTGTYVAVEGGDGALHAAVADCRGLERAGLALVAPLRDGTLAGPGRPWRGAAVLDGNLPAPVLAALLDEPALAGPLAIVPASPEKSARLAPLLGRRPVCLYLNRAEAEVLCGTGFADSRTAAAALAARLAVSAVVTDGPAPATAAMDGALVTRTPPSVAAWSVTGAGDAFVAAHLAARAEGCDAAAALDRAIAAAAHHVTRPVPPEDP